MKWFLTIIVIGLITIGLVTLFWQNNLLLFILLGLIALILLWNKKSKQFTKLFVFCAVLGTVAEVVAIHMGVWQYNNVDFLKIPFWLVILWGIASIYIVEIYLFFGRKK